MMSKYIVDSCLWWAKEYKIKGFRFDLMGLLDSWTMRKVKDSLYAYDKDIYVYGEGWTSGGYHGKYEAEYKANTTQLCPHFYKLKDYMICVVSNDQDVIWINPTLIPKQI